MMFSRDWYENINFDDLKNTSIANLESIEIQIDPLAGAISLIALIISFGAWRSARKAFLLAKKEQDSQGALAGASIKFTGWKPISRNGRTRAEQLAPGAGRTVLTVYSGRDELEVTSASVLVIFRHGILWSRIISVRINLDSQSPKLKIKGPTLPMIIGPYKQLAWELPGIHVWGPVSKSGPDMGALVPGVFHFTSGEAISIYFIAQTSSIKGAVSSGSNYGAGSIFPQFFPRHFSYENLGDMLSSTEVPEKLKRPFSPWVLHDSSQ